jgi:V/A-type H+-transporting ATPase subunit C
MADDTRYAYAVARVRGMETRLLDRQWIERLLSESADGALRALSDSAYQEAVAETDKPEEIEAALMRALAETLRVVSSISPEPELIDLFRERWDFRNLKSLLKASLLGVEVADIGAVDGIGLMPVAELERAASERDYVSLPDFMADAARSAEAAYRDRSELAAVDRILDDALWRHSLDVAAGHRNDFLVSYFRAEIDLWNIRTFVRVHGAGIEKSDLAAILAQGGALERGFFTALLGEGIDALARALEYGPYASLAPVFRDWSSERTPALELACDNVLLALTEVGKTIAYGIEPLVAYILVRGLEVKLVRAAVVGKLDGLERIEIEGRLRSAHV